MNDKPLTVCPKVLCGLKRWGKGKVKRAITSGAGLIFKGSGFYITDYRSDKYKEAAKKDSSSASSSSGTASDSKTSGSPPDTKPAPKKDAGPSKPSTKT